MNDLDVNRLEKATIYIDSLANGINPISGEALAGDVFDEPDVIRCLFFVKDILKSCMERPVKQKNESFTIDDETNLEKFLLNKPSSLSPFIKNIKEANNGVGPSANKIWELLVEKGYLYLGTDGEGKKTKLPTESGLQNGISYVERQGTNGKPYFAVIYDKTGQKLLLECIKELYAQ